MSAPLNQPVRITMPPKDREPKAPARTPNPRLPVLLTRAAMLLVFAMSVWLIWWSVNHRLLPVLQAGRKKTVEVSALGNEVQQLERQWDPVDAAHAEDRFKEAGQTLFAGPEQRQEREKELQDQAAALDFGVDIQPGTVQPAPGTKYKVSLQLTIIDLAAGADGSATNSPYQRLIAFTKLLQQQSTRMDLVELSATGNFNSIREAKAVVQLWSQEGKLE